MPRIGRTTVGNNVAHDRKAPQSDETNGLPFAILGDARRACAAGRFAVSQMLIRIARVVHQGEWL